MRLSRSRAQGRALRVAFPALLVVCSLLVPLLAEGPVAPVEAAPTGGAVVSAPDLTDPGPLALPGAAPLPAERLETGVPLASLTPGGSTGGLGGAAGGTSGVPTRGLGEPEPPSGGGGYSDNDSSAGGPGTQGPGGYQGSTSDLPVRLLVQEALPPGIIGKARPDAVATGGLPFSRGQVFEIAGRPALAVQGSDVYQARTLQRWPDGSVRWALLDAQVDVSPDEIDTTLTVVPGTGASGGPNIARPYLAGKALILDTGPLQAVILTQAFNLFAYVLVDGVAVVRPNLGLGLYGTAVDGGLLRPGPDTVVSVEENGPARSVVRADGSLVDPGGHSVIDYTCRIAARAGSRDLDVTLTLRNASAARPWHTQLESVELLARGDLGPSPRVRTALPGNAVHAQFLHDGQRIRAYQAVSGAPVNGFDSENWDPHVPREDGSLTDYVEEGFELSLGSQVLHPLSGQGDWVQRGWMELFGAEAGITVAIERMPYQWPAALEAGFDGVVTAGLFTSRCPEPYTFVFQQHESRRALFSFRAGPSGDPSQVARRADIPVLLRAADYLHYDRTGVLPYRLVTLEQQAEAYALMGINHNVQAGHPPYKPTRYLYKATTGPDNNSPLIETRLVSDWLRLGYGGSYLLAQNLSLWKAEWQILRSDDFVQADAPPVQNAGLPVTTGNESDDEHRWRDGMTLAYLLSGDERLRAALYDEVEVLLEVDLWPHERSMYQTLRAMGALLEFTGDPALKAALEERLQYVTSPLIDVDTATEGFGWEDTPGNGLRRYYVFSGDLNSEKPPGENFQARGFMSGTLGPAGYHQAARALELLEPGHPLAATARQRAADLSWWTRHELYPWHPDPAERKLAYSYAVSLQQVVEWDSFQFHPILLGQTEAFQLTGDPGYMDHAVSQVEAFHAVDTGPFDTNLHLLDSRLSCQHFFALYRAWKLGL